MATPIGNSVIPTGNTFIDGLLQGGKWSSGNLTYSLWDSEYGYWDAFSKSIVNIALQQFSNVANLSFTFTPNNDTNFVTIFNKSTDLSFMLTGDLQAWLFGSTGLGIFPDTRSGDNFLALIGDSRSIFPSPEGTILLDNFQLPFQSGSEPSGAGFFTIIHEVGHTLGLKHPHDDGGNYRPTFSELGIGELDSQFYTMMSYEETSYSTSSYNVATPMLFDIAALQYIYGANMNYQSGNTTWTLTDSEAHATVWDAGGIDTFDASTNYSDIFLDLRDGNFSKIGETYVAIAYNAIIENAVGGSGNDSISGNETHNSLVGRAGNDLISALGGNDLVYGDSGNDLLNGNRGIDAVYGGAGNDTVLGGKDNDITFGGTGNDFVNGNIGNDSVYGESGDDTVRGGQNEDYVSGGSGNDLIFGDKGNDTLNGGDGVDIFAFNPNSGIDIITDFELGTDIIRINSTIFTTTSDAVSAFSDSILDLGGGNAVTLTNITAITENDFIIV